MASTPARRLGTAFSLRSTEPTPRRSGSFLPAVTTFCGGGRATVWSQRRWLPAVDGGAAVVHHWILPRPRRHLNDIECRRCAQGVAPGRRTYGGGRLEHDTGGVGERPEGNGHHGSADRRST